MTLQQKRLRPITLIFEVWFYNYLIGNEDHIEMMCHYLAQCLALCVLYCIILSSVTYIASFTGLQEEGMIRAWNNFIDM